MDKEQTMIYTLDFNSRRDWFLHLVRRGRHNWIYLWHPWGAIVLSWVRG